MEKIDSDYERRTLTNLSCFNTALDFPKVVCKTFRPLKGPGKLSVYVSSPNEQLEEVTGVRTRALSWALSLMYFFFYFFLPLKSKAAVIVWTFLKRGSNSH